MARLRGEDAEVIFRFGRPHCRFLRQALNHCRSAIRSLPCAAMATLPAILLDQIGCPRPITGQERVLNRVVGSPVFGIPRLARWCKDAT